VKRVAARRSRNEAAKQESKVVKTVQAAEMAATRAAHVAMLSGSHA